LRALRSSLWMGQRRLVGVRRAGIQMEREVFSR
jgi:hypothetical protein